MTESTAHPPPNPDDRYLQPGWFTTNVFNRAVRALTRAGASVAGSRELIVVGRTSGEPRSTVVNMLDVGGQRYLVAPRGVTQWVRNLRAAGQGALRVGRRTETFRAEELADADKAAILRAYVERWGWEVGKFFEGISASSTDEELAAIAADFPVFRIQPSHGSNGEG